MPKSANEYRPYTSSPLTKVTSIDDTDHTDASETTPDKQKVDGQPAMHPSLQAYEDDLMEMIKSSKSAKGAPMATSQSTSMDGVANSRGSASTTRTGSEAQSPTQDSTTLRIDR